MALCYGKWQIGVSGSVVASANVWEVMAIKLGAAVQMELTSATSIAEVSSLTELRRKSVRQMKNILIMYFFSSFAPLAVSAMFALFSRRVGVFRGYKKKRLQK